jgi:hypothetical protein
MVWILVWVQLQLGQKLEYYHVESFETQEECFAELKKATVLVSHKNSAIDCIPIDIDKL